MYASLVSTYLHYQWKQVLASQRDPLAAQERAFRRLQSQYVSTQQASQLAHESLKDYIREGVRKTYSDYASDLAGVLKAPRRHHLYQGQTRFIGLTSGTTLANSKTIPFNDHLMRNFMHYQSQVAAVAEKHFDLRFGSDKRITWGSSALVDHSCGGIPAGYVSGFFSTQSPSFMRGLTYPSPAIACLDSMQDKARAMAREIKGLSPTLISGVPTYVLQLLEILKHEWRIDDFAKAWPQLQTMIYAATAIAPYRQRLEELIGRSLNVLGCYIATEAPLGYEIPCLSGGRDAVYHFYLDGPVLAFQKSDSDRLLGLGDLNVGDEVEVLTSTANGFLHYAIGDRLRILSMAPTITFEILGRVGQGLNLATEKTTQKELELAIVATGRQTQVAIEHFFVHPGSGLCGKPCYEWTLLTSPTVAVDIDMEAVIDTLDRELQALNIDYEEARTKNGLLDRPRLHIQDAELVRRYFDQESHRGQLKLRSIFSSSEEFRQFESRYRNGHQEKTA